jgi:broad specificity phosphatase PhoE
MFGTQPTATAPTVVFLARHAETEWNVGRRFQGHLDSSLTERGVQQARLLAKRLADEPLVAVYSSDLGRTLRTAEIVAARHGLKVQTHPGLREIDTGAWTGLHRDDVRAVPEWVAMLEVYRKRPAEHCFPDGESIRDVQGRALGFLREVAPRHAGQAIAVISHHVVVETIIAHALGVPLEELWLPQRGGNCFLSTIEVIGDVITPKVIYDGCHISEELIGLDGTKGERAEKGTA